MIVAIYDVTGIQSFVYASRKMKENVGASHMVDLVLSKWLPKIVQKLYPSAKTALKKSFVMPSEDLQATIVYIGGGNAMVIYKSKDEYLAVNKVLSKKILDETANELQVASAWVDLTKDVSTLRKSLFQKLAIEKATRTTSLPLQGIGITRACDSDGLPAIIDEKKEYLSLPTSNKRKYAEKRNDYFKGRFSGFSFPSLLDDLGGTEGNNYISVVHIDGNGMGSMLNAALAACNTPKSWFATMNSLSIQISEAYESVFVDMLNTLKFNQGISKFQEIFAVKDDGMLIRPLVVNGDDLTFITDGRLGIPLAQDFLEKLSSKSIQVGNEEKKLSACAGIAIVKNHFPFYRAYDLAEKLCASAKKKAKVIDGADYGSWIDWHIAQGGLVNDLGELRRKQYLVPGMGRPDINGINLADMPLYNLLFRPWKIGEGNFSFNRFPELIKGFEGFPRSRWKTLRNSAILSEEAINNCLMEMESRGYQLPVFMEESEFYPSGKFSNLTPYFDVLESSEFYYSLEKEGNHA